MDPGAYSLEWILEPGESKNAVMTNEYLTQKDIDEAIQSKNNID
jgi:hypothetical protein